MPRTRLESAIYWYEQQKKWVADHGTTRAAYVARYGSASDPDHYGDGGEAIHAADTAALERLEQEAMAELERWSKRRAK